MAKKMGHYAAKDCGLSVRQLMALWIECQEWQVDIEDCSALQAKDRLLQTYFESHEGESDAIEIAEGKEQNWLNVTLRPQNEAYKIDALLALGWIVSKRSLR